MNKVKGVVLMSKFKSTIVLLLSILACFIISPIIFGESAIEEGQIIDLELIRRQVLLGNSDYLLAQLELETAQIQLTSAVADHLQRASALSVKQAESGLKTAQRNLDVSAKNAQLDAETKYYTLIKSIRQLEISQDALEQAREQLRIIKAKYSEGMATNTDVSQAEQAVLQSENNYESACNNLLLAKAQLNNVLGFTLDYKLTVVEEDFSYSTLDLSFEEIVILALENNTALIELEEQLEIARLDEKSADNDFTAPLMAQSKTLQRQKLELRLTEMKQQTYLRTMELWNNVQALSNNYLASLLSVETAEENYRIIQVRFDDGLEIPVNLLSSRLDLAKAKQQTLNSLFDYNIAKSQLMINLGLK